MESEAWKARAACRGRFELMLGDDVDAAKALCARCPVRPECLRLGVDEELLGVFGGLDYAQRTHICPVCLGPKRPGDLACSG